MPAKSVAQQRFMGMVHALQKGDIKPSKVSGKVKDVAKSMKKKDTKDFASTKHKNKPYKVKKEVVRKLREIIRQEVESCGYTMSAENPKRKLKSPGGTGPEDRDLKVEGQRATKGFKKAFKARNDFFIAMSDFRKKLGDMGTNPKIFKLESELYKFEMDFQKSSAKILDFMQRLSKSPITEAYEMSPAQEKNLKYAIKLYRKGSGKSIEAEVRTIAYALKKGKFTKSAKEIVDTFNKFNKAIDNVLGQHESVNEVNRVALKVYIDWFKKDAKKAKVTPLEYTKYQIRYPAHYGLDKKTLKALLKYFQKNESVNEIRNKREAETLLQQLGGNKFKMMTGAKNFGIDGKSLTFSIGRNSKGINFVRIKLTSMDLYDIQFAQLRMGQVKVKSTAKRVYGDQLGKVFKKHTGMNVRLFGESINEAPKNYDRAMKKMLDFMKKSAYKQYDKRFPFHIESNTWQYPKLLKKGRTFDKLVTVRNNAPNKAQSADFFVHRETGDIYKAASWSSPAKGRRGSIFEPNTYKHYDIHGGWLYRRR